MDEKKLEDVAMGAMGSGVNTSEEDAA